MAVINTDLLLSKFCNICCSTDKESIKSISDVNVQLKDTLISLIGQHDVVNKSILYLCWSCREVLTKVTKFREMCLNNLVRIQKLYLDITKSKVQENEIGNLLEMLKTSNKQESSFNLLNKQLEQTTKRHVDEDGALQSPIKKRKTIIDVLKSNKSIEVICINGGVNELHKSDRNAANIPNVKDVGKVGSKFKNVKTQLALSERGADVTKVQLGNAVMSRLTSPKDLKHANEESIYISDDDEQTVTNRTDKQVNSVSKNKSRWQPVRTTAKKLEKQKSVFLPPELEDDKIYKCVFKGCKKAYSKKGSLKAHHLVHTGVRPYKCNWEGCEWRFLRATQLTRHYRRHTGIKPFKCLQCGKCFGRSDKLTQHVRACHE